MSLSTFIATNLQTADWRINVNRTDLTKAIVTPTMIHDIYRDDADRARGILATIYHSDRPRLRVLCGEYCQQYKADYDTLWANWESWVLTGLVGDAAAEAEVEADGEPYYCPICLEEAIRTGEEWVCRCGYWRDKAELIARSERDEIIRRSCKSTEPKAEELYCPVCLLMVIEEVNFDYNIRICEQCNKDYYLSETLTRTQRDAEIIKRNRRELQCGNCGQRHHIQLCPEIVEALSAPAVKPDPIALTTFGTSIEYDLTSHRFIGKINGHICGEYETYFDAEQDITAFAEEMSLSIAVGDSTPTDEDERISRLVHALAELQETAEQAEDYAAVRAFSRAAYHVGKGIDVRAAEDAWLVPSGTRPSTTHTVSQCGGAIVCSCEAGRQGSQCWHAALIEGQLKAGQ